MQDSLVLESYLDKITRNSERVVAKCLEKEIQVIGVTKGFSAMHEIVAAMHAGGIEGFADSRMENNIIPRGVNQLRIGEGIDSRFIEKKFIRGGV